MRAPQNQWPDTDRSKSVLFVAQLIRELLDPETFETNRIFSLDTMSRLQECIDLYSKFRSGAVSKAALKAPLNEARWSITIDPVVASSMSQASKDAIISQLGQFGDLDKANQAIVYARNKLDPIYKKRLEANIVDCLETHPEKRISLRVNVSFYCSYLVNSGYSRAYISASADNVFFSHDHQRVSTRKVEQFFSYFPSERFQYYVYCGVSADLGEIVSGISSEVKNSGQTLEHHDADVKAKLPLGRGQKYALLEIDELDPISAATSANKIIEHVRALAFLNPKASNVSWQRKFYVAKKRERSGETYGLPQSPLDWLSPQQDSEPRILRDIRRYSAKILTNFDRDSSGRVLRSVSTAADARHSQSVETQLISLWSAVEGLVDEPVGDTPRIQHFSDRIIPCICRRHLHRRSAYMYEILKGEYGNRFTRIVRTEPDFPNMYMHFRFSAIFMFSKNKPLIRRILNVSTDNPLALHRMYQFWKDCKSPATLMNCTQTHRDRVTWQLSRIYRARNSLVHRAEPPFYLDSLVLNMFEYYIRMLATIVRAAGKHEHRVSLDQVISEIRMESVALHKVFQSKQKDSEIDKELFLQINS